MEDIMNNNINTGKSEIRSDISGVDGIDSIDARVRVARDRILSGTDIMKTVFSESGKRYYTYDYYLKKRFGGKCMKIPLDGGFTCPNIDGTKGVGGCTYCSHRPPAVRGLPIEEQYKAVREPLIKKWGKDRAEERCIPYFQSYTNTYAPTDYLRNLYYSALALPGAIGLSIGTRADCISDSTAELLREINEKTYLTVELGLQTVHDETAVRINRCHTYEDFLKGVEKLKGLNICVHLINGLPGETPYMMLESASEIARLEPHEVKLHMLYIERGCGMYDEYLRGEINMLSLEEYADIVCRQLEVLPPDTVIGRITGDGEADLLAAPEWSRKKFVVMNTIDKLMRERDVFQGDRYIK